MEPGPPVSSYLLSYDGEEAAESPRGLKPRRAAHHVLVRRGRRAALARRVSRGTRRAGGGPVTDVSSSRAGRSRSRSMSLALYSVYSASVSSSSSASSPLPVVALHWHNRRQRYRGMPASVHPHQPRLTPHVIDRKLQGTATRPSCRPMGPAVSRVGSWV